MSTTPTPTPEVLSLQVPAFLRKQAEQAAFAEGVSLNTFILTALMESIDKRTRMSATRNEESFAQFERT